LRKLFSLLPFVVVAAAIPATAGATHSPGNEGPNHDFAVGGGISGVATHVGFAAQSGPNGENPRGHVTLHNFAGLNPVERKGHVICLQVDGDPNQGRAIFEIQEEENGRPTGTFRRFYAEDNGEPVNGTPVDRLNQVGRQTSTPQGCSRDITEPLTAIPLTKGNFTIHDAE
jgi:hypothetical protein